MPEQVRTKHVILIAQESAHITNHRAQPTTLTTYFSHECVLVVFVVRLSESNPPFRGTPRAFAIVGLGAR
jgi:hypothetical protein